MGVGSGRPGEYPAASAGPAPRARAPRRARSRGSAAPADRASPAARRSPAHALEAGRRGRPPARRRGRPRRAARGCRGRARWRAGRARRPPRWRPSPTRSSPSARERVGVVQDEQAAQLGERLRVVLDAQVDDRAPRLARRRDDEQRGRLAAAHVAARRLGGVQRREQPAGERLGRSAPRTPRPSPATPRREAIMFAWQEKPVSRCRGRRTGCSPRRCARRRGPARRRPRPGGRAPARRRRGARRAPLGRSRPRAGSRARRPVGGLGDRLRGDRADARARAHVTIGPTENQCDCTATPSSPVCGVAGDDRVGAPAHRAQRTVAPVPPLDLDPPARSACSTASARSRRASCAPTATSIPGAPRFAGTVLSRLRGPDRAVAPRRARRRLAGQGRAPAPAARGGGRAVPRRARWTWRACGYRRPRCGSSARSCCARARAASTSSRARCSRRCPSSATCASGCCTSSSATPRRR